MDATNLLAQASESGMSAQGVITLLFVVFGFLAYKTPKGVWVFIGKKTGLSKQLEKLKQEEKKEKSKTEESNLPPDVAKYAVDQPEQVEKEEEPEEFELPPFEDYSVPEGTSSDDPMMFLNPVAWPEMCRKRKLGGLQFLGRDDTPFGVDVSVKFGGSLSFAYVQSNIDQLRTGLNLPHDWRIQLKKGPSSAYGTVRIITHDPLEGELVWQPSPSTVRLADPLWISRTPYGENVTVLIKRRLGIFGTSGSGKSCVERLVAAHVIQAVDADLDMWDLKYGLESQHFEGKAHRVTTVNEAVDRTRWLMEVEYPRRAQIMKENRTSTWEESSDNPALVVMIDEGNRIVRGFTTAQLKQLAEAIETGRALGVYFVWATQYPKSENLPTEIRSQFDSRICLLLMNAEESRVVYKEAVDDGWAPHLLIGPGWMYVKDTEHTVPEESKALWLDKDTIPTIPVSSSVQSYTPSVVLPDSSVSADICKALSDPDAPMAMGVSELSRRTGRSKSAVHGALSRMETEGQVCRTDEDRPRYYLPPSDEELS
jgi:DNA translocase FtsK/SpoIIIE-like protein/IclR-like helix-turn-helix domain-containing protein